MMANIKTLIVYSSITGNTKKVAYAIHDSMPGNCTIASLKEAPDPEGFDIILLGFWVTRGGPDKLMARYMERVKGKRVGVFATLAAWPDSPHAEKVKDRAKVLLDGNTIICTFLCQGKLNPKLIRESEEASSQPEHRKRHPMTEERKARLKEAEKHPDENDLQKAKGCFHQAIEALQLS